MANKKISGLNPAQAVLPDDLLPIVQSVNGTLETRKVTVEEVLVQSDYNLVSSDNSILVDISQNGKTKDIRVNSPVEIYYATDAQSFNSGVKSLNLKGGGTLYIAGAINFSQFSNIPVQDRMFDIEEWESNDLREDVGGNRLTNSDSVINFRDNLDSIQIKRYTATGQFIVYTSDKKFYTLKGDRLMLFDIAFNRYNTPIEYSQFKQTTQPYLICNISATVTGCQFLCDGGSGDDVTPPSKPFRNHVWQAGTVTDGYGIFINLTNCRSGKAYFRNGDLPVIQQNEIIVNITGSNESNSRALPIHIGCYYLWNQTQVAPDKWIFRVIDNCGKTTGGQKNFYIVCPLLFGIISNGDFLPPNPGVRVPFIDAALATNNLLLYDVKNTDSQKILAIDENGLVQTTTITGEIQILFEKSTFILTENCSITQTLFNMNCASITLTDASNPNNQLAINLSNVQYPVNLSQFHNKMIIVEAIKINASNEHIGISFLTQKN